MTIFKARNGATLKPIIAGGQRITYSNGVTYALPEYALSALREFFAEEFYEKHPELRPKPWEELSRPGEVWVVRFRTGPTFDEMAVVVPEGGWTNPDLDVIDAYRIWKP